ncbi:MAG: leucine-rich repeat domain-containing protein [Flavobacteriales bacterium]|nr:leucine-rich repeat domain-containing protein [Flavobacteriales bacterium]
MKQLKLILTACLCLLATLAVDAQLIEYKKLDTARVFTKLDEALLNPTKVYRLDLSRQKLKAFPEEIFLFINLNELILDKNKIVEIPDRINGMRHLQRLSVSKNRLEDFNPNICRLIHLIELDLSENYLTEIPDEIRKLEKMEKLILWSNLIRYFPTSLGQLENLKEFDLLHNEMNQMEQDRLKNLMPRTYIHFSTPCACFFDDESEEE